MDEETLETTEQDDLQNSNMDGEPEEADGADEGYEPEAEPEAEPAAEPQEPTAQAQTRQIPAMALPSGLTPEQKAYLEEQFSVDPIGVIDYLQKQNLAQFGQVQAHTNAYVAQDSQKYPDWYREHAGTVQRVLATLPDHVRPTPQAMNVAKLGVLLEELNGGADFAATLERHAAIARGRKAPVAQQAAVLPPTQRVAGGGGGGGAVTRPATQSSRSADSRAVAYIKGLNPGMNTAQAERLAREL